MRKYEFPLERKILPGSAHSRAAQCSMIPRPTTATLCAMASALDTAACADPVREVACSRVTIIQAGAFVIPHVPRSMPRDLTADYSDLLADKIRLPARIEQLRNVYRNATPFPHLVIDELFPPEILDPVLEEMAALAGRRWLLVENESHE